MQAKGGRAVKAIEAAFPGTTRERRRRSRRPAPGGPRQPRRPDAPGAHPASDGRAEERAFVARARRAGRRAVVLDIPLLFETKGDKRVDTVVVVSAPRAIQIHRVGQRRRMSKADVEAVIARQMPDREKRRRADLVVRTGLSRNHALRILRRFIQDTAGMIRSVLFDTETTGLDPLNGDRVIEVAALELIERPAHRQAFPRADRSRSATFRPRPRASTASPTATWRASRCSPRSPEPLPEFFADSKLIAHNAPFDFGFLDMEFGRVGLPPLGRDRMIDSLALAKTRFPGHAEQPGCAVPPLRHRPVGAHHPQRAAGLQAARRGLCRTDRRPPARPVAGGARTRGDR